MNLQDKVAVVTGASSGLGRMFAQTLVEHGMQVFGLARSLDQMNALRDEIGESFHPVRCDVRDSRQVSEAFEVVLESGRRLDALINNAGLGRFDRVVDLTDEDWDVQMETNLRGVFLCARAAIPQMKKQNGETGFGGYIINVASIAGLLGNPNLAAYNASKFGVRGFSEALMKEVRDDGIKVTCIYPGSVETGFSVQTNPAASTNKMLPEDIAATVVHLLETRDNYLISELVMRPLRPRG